MSSSSECDSLFLSEGEEYSSDEEELYFDEIVCECNLPIFIYFDMSKNTIEGCCSKVSKIIESSKNKKIIFKDSSKKPCSYKYEYKYPPSEYKFIYDRVSYHMKNYEEVVEYFNNNTKDTKGGDRWDYFIRMIGSFEIDRNNLIFYIEKFKDQMPKELLELGYKKLKENDENILNQYIRYIRKIENSPSFGLISEITLFLEKYTITPKFYINNLLDGYSEEGIKKFYSYTIQIMNDLKKNGFVYIEPKKNTNNNIEEYKKLIKTPEYVKQITKNKPNYHQPKLKESYNKKKMIKLPKITINVENSDKNKNEYTDLKEDSSSSEQEEEEIEEEENDNFFISNEEEEEEEEDNVYPIDQEENEESEEDQDYGDYEDKESVVDGEFSD